MDFTGFKGCKGFKRRKGFKHCEGFSWWIVTLVENSEIVMYNQKPFPLIKKEFSKWVFLNLA